VVPLVMSSTHEPQMSEDPKRADEPRPGARTSAPRASAPPSDRYFFAFDRWLPSKPQADEFVWA
jgi:hypothetical protein